jgi:F-type H+-transporting ATPase subunit gamma
MESAKPFTRKLATLLGRLALDPKALEHPLFDAREGAGLPALVVLFTSDRGLCGAFNANLIKTADRYLRKHPDALLFCVGRKGTDYFKRRIGERLVGNVADLGGKLDGETTDALGARFQQMFLEKKVASVQIIAPEFVSTAFNRPQRVQYLPLEPKAFGLSEEEASRPIDYLLEPSPERVFDAVLPRYLKSQIFLTLAETQTCEHASRMLAMNNATKNCGELSDALTLEMNKARQAAITTELIEIVSGANALEG